ncbi:MAG: FkbM family methyltransferase [Christensenellaceae bacterium]|nr:FkbM family methyltransferase [Christensenellaceae bacterium]
MTRLPPWLADLPFWPEHLKALSHQGLPIVLYGMGNGADKIIDILQEYGVPVSGIFASDDFVRDKVFRGFKVERYRDLKARFGQMAVVVAFATQLSEIMLRIDDIAIEQTLIYPDLPVFGGGLVTPAYLAEHADAILAAHDAFADERSRRVFRGLLRFKLTGDLRELRPITSPRREVFSSLIPLTDKEHYLDLGAYNGDTIREFLRHAQKGHYASITAVEPAQKNFQNLSAWVEEEGLPGCTPVNAAVSDVCGTLSFSGKSGRAACLGEGKQTVEVTTVDALLSGRPVTYVKMDVEGEEAPTLRGMAGTLAAAKPKLSVSAYHRLADLWELPALIRSLRSDYKIYLRKHDYYPGWESVIYAH